MILGGPSLVVVSGDQRRGDWMGRSGMGMFYIIINININIMGSD